MLTGVFAGDRDDRAIRELVRTSLFTAVLYDAILCALLLAGAGILMPLFTSDTGLLALTVDGFRLYCLSMIGYSVNVTLRHYYQAMHFAGLSYIYVFCNSFLFPVTGAFLLSSMIGVSGVWLAFLFGETVTLLLLAVRTLIKTPKRGSLIDRAMFIPPEMTAEVIVRFDGAAGDMLSMTELSERVRVFCLENGADVRTAYILSLSVEEIGNYILRNNASRDAKAEVRILQKKDGWSMSMRDNGRLFDPLAILRDGSRYDPASILQEDAADAFSYIGIRLICGMARKTEYLDTLNVNHLNIEI